MQERNFFKGNLIAHRVGEMTGENVTKDTYASGNISKVTPRSTQVRMQCSPYWSLHHPVNSQLSWISCPSRMTQKSPGEIAWASCFGSERGVLSPPIFGIFQGGKCFYGKHQKITNCHYSPPFPNTMIHSSSHIWFRNKNSSTRRNVSSTQPSRSTSTLFTRKPTQSPITRWGHPAVLSLFSVPVNSSVSDVRNLTIQMIKFTTGTQV